MHHRKHEGLTRKKVSSIRFATTLHRTSATWQKFGQCVCARCEFRGFAGARQMNGPPGWYPGTVAERRVAVVPFSFSWWCGAEGLRPSRRRNLKTPRVPILTCVKLRGNGQAEGGFSLCGGFPHNSENISVCLGVAVPFVVSVSETIPATRTHPSVSTLPHRCLPGPGPWSGPDCTVPRGLVGHVADEVPVHWLTLTPPNRLSCLPLCWLVVCSGLRFPAWV